MTIEINPKYQIGDKFEVTYTYPHPDGFKKKVVIQEIVGIVIDLGYQYHKYSRKYNPNEIGFAYRLTDPSRITGTDKITRNEDEMERYHYRKINK